MNETATEKHDKIVCQIARNYKKFLSSFVLYNSALISTGQSSFFVKSGISLSANADDVPPGFKTSLFLETPVGRGSLDIYIKNVLLKHEKEEKGILIDIAVEVKSHIKSITETIRQINKHRESMRKGPDLYIIASPDDRYIDILEGQNIIFYDASLCKDW